MVGEGSGKRRAAQRRPRFTCWAHCKFPLIWKLPACLPMVWPGTLGKRMPSLEQTSGSSSQRYHVTWVYSWRVPLMGSGTASMSITSRLRLYAVGERCP